MGRQDMDSTASLVMLQLTNAHPLAETALLTLRLVWQCRRIYALVTVRAPGTTMPSVLSRASWVGAPCAHLLSTTHHTINV